MRPPCEIVQREFLPVLRAKLARSLKKKGHSQTEIAQYMNVTQAAVSKYLGQRVPQSRMRSEIDSLVPQLIGMLDSPSVDPDSLVREICSVCMVSRVGSTLCKMHQSGVSSLRQANCQICADLLGGQDEVMSKRVGVLADMREALRYIEESTSFHLVVPQVRANLVACAADVKTVEDVAGVPGRITVIDGRARALVGAQFGASQHTAEILLQAKEMWKGIRACLCISGSNSVSRIATKSGVTKLSIRHPETNAQKIMNSITPSARRKVSKSSFPAVQVPGGVSVEPILYLFGPSAAEVTKKGIELADNLSA